MTRPVLTQVKPCDGPVYASSYVVSFYIPKNINHNPPRGKGIHLTKQSITYIAIRQLSEFLVDDDILKEFDALSASIADTKQAEAIKKCQATNNTMIYIVVQYKSPFEFKNRVNDIWFTFDLNKASAI